VIDPAFDPPSPQAAYDLWQEGGRTWMQVAVISGHATPEAACMAARRYADKHSLPIRFGRKGKEDPERRKKSYCAFLLGQEWAEIADEYGWANANSARSSVVRYAATHDLPLRRLP